MMHLSPGMQSQETMKDQYCPLCKTTVLILQMILTIDRLKRYEKKCTHCGYSREMPAVEKKEFIKITKPPGWEALHMVQIIRRMEIRLNKANKMIQRMCKYTGKKIYHELNMVVYDGYEEASEYDTEVQEFSDSGEKCLRSQTSR